MINYEKLFGQQSRDGAQEISAENLFETSSDKSIPGKEPNAKTTYDRRQAGGAVARSGHNTPLFLRPQYPFADA